MTTPITAIGPHRPGDRRGWLLFECLPPDLQRAEDATAAADYARQFNGTVTHAKAYDPYYDRYVWGFERPATSTERVLLEHLGYTVPETLDTRVQFVTETLRRRRWPSLETDTPQGDTAA